MTIYTFTPLVFAGILLKSLTSFEQGSRYFYYLTFITYYDLSSSLENYSEPSRLNPTTAQRAILMHYRVTLIYSVVASYLTVFKLIDIIYESSCVKYTH